MDSLLQSISSLCIYAAVQFVDEPQRSALGPILLGAWEGASMYYVAHSFHSAAPYLIYIFRLLIYHHLSEDSIGLGLMVLWTGLGMLFSEALCRKHWYDTTEERRRTRRSTKRPLPDVERSLREERFEVGRPREPRPAPTDAVAPIPSVSRPSVRSSVAPVRRAPSPGPSRIAPSLPRAVSTVPNPRSLVSFDPVSQPSQPASFNARPPSPPTPEPTEVDRVDEPFSPPAVLLPPPPSPQPPPPPPASPPANFAPLSPISLSFSRVAENISTPAPEYTLEAPPMAVYPQPMPIRPSAPVTNNPPRLPVAHPFPRPAPPVIDSIVPSRPVVAEPVSAWLRELNKSSSTRASTRASSRAPSVPPVAEAQSSLFEESRPPSVRPILMRSSNSPSEQRVPEPPHNIIIPQPVPGRERAPSIPPLSAIEGFPFAYSLQSRPPSVQPMLFRPSTIVEASVEDSMSIANTRTDDTDPTPAPGSDIHTTPPDSPAFLPDDSDPLQTPMSGHADLPGSRPSRSRRIEDDPLMTPQAFSDTSFSSDEDVPLAARIAANIGSSRTEFQPPPSGALPSIDSRLGENNSAIPIPVPLPSSSRAAAPASYESPAPTTLGTPDITVSQANELRQAAWDEEARRRTLNQAHAAALRNGDQPKAFMLQGEIEESTEKIRKLHERAKRRHYHARNPLANVETIDVHGLLISEAVSHTEKAFRQVLVERRTSLRVIVGKGLHSKDGRAKLKPAIENAMAKHGINCSVDPHNGGVLILSSSWVLS